MKIIKGVINLLFKKNSIIDESSKVINNEIVNNSKQRYRIELNNILNNMININNNLISIIQEIEIILTNYIYNSNKNDDKFNEILNKINLKLNLFERNYLTFTKLEIKLLKLFIEYPDLNKEINNLEIKKELVKKIEPILDKIKEIYNSSSTSIKLDNYFRILVVEIKEQKIKNLNNGLIGDLIRLKNELILFNSNLKNLMKNK